MPTMHNLVIIVSMPFLIYFAGIPVALFRDALSGPVCPDAELGIPEPFRALILPARAAKRLKAPVPAATSITRSPGLRFRSLRTSAANCELSLSKASSYAEAITL